MNGLILYDFHGARAKPSREADYVDSGAKSGQIEHVDIPHFFENGHFDLTAIDTKYFQFRHTFRAENQV